MTWTMLAGLASNKYAQVAGALFGALLAVVLWGWHKESVGYTRGTAEVTAKVNAATAAERARIEAANKQAATDAQAAIDALAKRADALNAIIEENARAATVDPRRDDAGLGSGSVQRLNRIR